jgi:hypothetical protein
MTTSFRDLAHTNVDWLVDPVLWLPRKLYGLCNWLVRKLYGFCKRNARAILLVILGLVVAHAITTAIFARRVEAVLAALKAKGEPVAIRGVVPSKIPDSENGAIVFARAFKLLPKENRSDDPIGIVCSPEERAKDPAIWTKAEKAATAARPILALAEQAMTRKQFRFPVKWEDGVSARFEHLSWLSQIVRYSCAAAIVEARKGNAEAAARYLKLAFDMSRALEEEPSIMSQFVRYAQTRLAFSALADVIGSADLSASQTKSLENQLSGIDFRPGLKLALRGERVLCGLWIYRALMDGRIKGSDLFADTDLPQSAGAVCGYELRPLFYHDELVYLAAMSRAIREADLPYRSIRPSAQWDYYSWFAPVTSILCPSYTHVAGSRDRATAQVALSRVALALIDYKRQFGAYPPSLQAIQPRLGREVLEDPFTGKPFVYRRQGKGFLLYSLGMNLKDDKGQPRIKSNTGDIVIGRGR